MDAESDWRDTASKSCGDVTVSTYLRLDMHAPDVVGGLVRLEHVLDLIESSVTEWRLVFFSGIARKESDLNVLALESDVRDSRNGVSFTPRSLALLAKKIDQIVDCELHGYVSKEVQGTGAEPVVIVRAFDSSEWIVEADESRIRIQRNGIFE